MHGSTAGAISRACPDSPARETRTVQRPLTGPNVLLRWSHRLGTTVATVVPGNRCGVEYTCIPNMAERRPGAVFGIHHDLGRLASRTAPWRHGVLCGVSPGRLVYGRRHDPFAHGAACAVASVGGRRPLH